MVKNHQNHILIIFSKIFTGLGLRVGSNFLLDSGPNQTSGKHADFWLLIGRAFGLATRLPSGSHGACLRGVAGSGPRVPGDRARNPEFQGRRPTASISRLLSRRHLICCYPRLCRSTATGTGKLPPDPDTSSLGLLLVCWPPQAREDVSPQL